MQNNYHRYFRYAVQFLGWTLFLLFATEVFVRLVIVSFPSFDSKVNGGGVEIYGLQGYGFVYYLPNMEIATPYSGGDNIITLGDSFTQARQVPYWKNYSSISEKELRSKGYAVDVRNFGYMGGALPYYVGIGKSLIETYRPHLVVIQVSLADFTGAEVFNPSLPFHFAEESGQLMLKSNVLEDGKWLKLSSRTTNQPTLSFYNRFSIQTLLDIRKRQPTINPDDPIYPETTAVPEKIYKEETYSQELSLVESAYGKIPIIFILQPEYNNKRLAFTYNPQIEKLVSLIEQHTAWSVIYLDAPFNQIIRDGFSPIGFNNTEPFSGHWNIHGHEIVGKLLAEKIAALIDK
jgi:hypothetical protein